MIWEAFYLQHEYAKLKMPVVIIAGDKDRLINIDAQSGRLHRAISQSKFHRVSESGHMIHQTATGIVMAAINEVGRIVKQRSAPAHFPCTENSNRLTR